MSLEDLCRAYLQMEQVFHVEQADCPPSGSQIEERKRMLAGLYRDIQERVAAGESPPDWFSPHAPPIE